MTDTNVRRDQVTQALIEKLEDRRLRSITLMPNGAGTQMVQVVGETVTMC